VWPSSGTTSGHWCAGARDLDGHVEEDITFRGLDEPQQEPPNVVLPQPDSPTSRPSLHGGLRGPTPSTPAGRDLSLKESAFHGKCFSVLGRPAGFRSVSTRSRHSHLLR